MIVLNLIVMIVLVVFSIKDTREIKSLEKMALKREEYIKLLEKRNREDRIYKNNQFNKQK
jgi:heme exporter protein D